MKGEFYYSLMLFFLCVLIFPVIYPQALNNSIDNLALSETVKMLPILILIFTGVIPVIFAIDERG